VRPFRILFVCSGNICRSPLAEAIFRKLADDAGLAERIEVDSAGTHSYHEGEPADPRTRRVGQRHGVRVASIAREVEERDFGRFDLIVAMDRGHLRQLASRGGAVHRSKLRLMRDFDADASSPDVPDPYYGGEAGFEEVYAILHAACRALLEELQREARVS
jgi:protein-tyrosine phosphatase